MRAKGETSGELGGLVAAMLAHAPAVRVQGRAVDTCGTGGDGAHTVNISTMASLVVAGAGATVVKHGNRAASSACGSADLLEALGVVIDLPPAGVEECVARAGIGFCFAPVFHAGMRHAAVPRRELGVPTFFNVLGPLTNPSRPAAQAVGVSDARMAPVVAGVLAARGASALVFRGDDGLDELTVTTTSRVWEVRDGEVVASVLDPREVGVGHSAAETLRGADAAFNARVARDLLAGTRGPVRDAVLLNAAAALTAHEPTSSGPLAERLAVAARPGGRGARQRGRRRGAPAVGHRVAGARRDALTRCAQSGGPGGPGGPDRRSGGAVSPRRNRSRRRRRGRAGSRPGRRCGCRSTRPRRPC